MKQKRAIILCMVLLLLLTAIPRAGADTAKAENLTGRCSFDFGKYREAAERVLSLGNGYQQFDPHASFSFTWEQLPEARLCIYWREFPKDVTVLQYDEAGDPVRSDPVPCALETVMPIAPEARRIVVQAGENRMRITWCAVFGQGDLPKPFLDWQDTPQKLDYLMIATHPDDDILYLGSVVPVYGAERGYVGTIVYVTTETIKRGLEAENGAWAMGLRYRPVFWDFPDLPKKASEKQRKAFVYDDLLLAVVRMYRKHRPAVVFTQDQNGEYGHWQHVQVSKAVREAVSLAADPTFDPDSAKEYGTWQVQKLFLHLYPENTIRIDTNAPLSFFDGKNALDVAREAFKLHASQQGFGYHVEKSDSQYAFDRFGMAEGVVPVGEDAFDNIDETLLSSYVAPEPTSEPNPEPIAEITPEPTPEPIAEITPEPTSEPTVEPTPEPIEKKSPEPTAAPVAEPLQLTTEAPPQRPTPEAERGAEAEQEKGPAIPRLLIAVAIGIVVLAAYAGIAALIRNRRPTDM